MFGRRGAGRLRTHTSQKQPLSSAEELTAMIRREAPLRVWLNDNEFETVLRAARSQTASRWSVERRRFRKSAEHDVLILARELTAARRQLAQVAPPANIPRGVVQRARSWRRSARRRSLQYGAKVSLALTTRDVALMLVLARTCALCGCELDPRDSKMTQIDHVIPLSEGGTHARSNLQVICHSCHAEKDGTAGIVTLEREVLDRGLVQVAPELHQSVRIKTGVTRTCRLCQSDRPLESFIWSSSGQAGMSERCSNCRGRGRRSTVRLQSVKITDDAVEEYREFVAPHQTVRQARDDMTGRMAHGSFVDTPPEWCGFRRPRVNGFLLVDDSTCFVLDKKRRGKHRVVAVITRPAVSGTSYSPNQ